MSKFLTRQEELLMLAIWRLKENAYGMAIKEHMEKITDSKWSFGAIYAPLGRLLKKNMVTTEKGEPTPEKGGKSKVFYSITPLGKEELLKARKVNEASWTGIPLSETE